MLPKVAISVVTSLGLAALSPIAASASQTAFGVAPVSLSACSTNTTVAFASPYDTPRLASDVQYHFTNNAPVAAQAVTLNVSLNGQSSQIVERGTFSPGVGIDRSIADYAAVSGPITCRVTQVDFRDGTSWHAGGEAKVSAR